jgi:CTP synthase
LATEGADVGIVEVGGTVGDIESLPFLEAIRQIRYDLGDSNVLYVHLTLVPYIGAAHELKTKPTQHSVKELRQIGIQPHILICRADRPLPTELKEKIGLFCNVRADCVIDSADLDSIYKVPLYLHEQGLDQTIVEQLNIWTRSPDLTVWKKIEEALINPESVCNIGIVGKYTDVIDSYKSINEALVHAGIKNRSDVRVHYFDAASINQTNVADELGHLDGVIVPGGFGDRGIDGKIQSIRFVRENKIPFLGICLGMQLAAIEFARHVLRIESADSEEFSANRVIHLMKGQSGLEETGGTMRLGAYPCHLLPKTKAAMSYDTAEISERHRHRFEFNNEYRSAFEANGVIFSGLSPDGKLVEIMELQDHPWFVACQFHPELKSSPMKPHALFRDLVASCVKASLNKS